jgi:hypothetical protein
VPDVVLYCPLTQDTRERAQINGFIFIANTTALSNNCIQARQREKHKLQTNKLYIWTLGKYCLKKENLNLQSWEYRYF